jgi:hypothetical protein
MMKRFAKTLLSVTFGFALIMPCASIAQTEIAKSGTFSLWFGWHSFGTLTDLGKGAMEWHGEFDGALRNDAGSGFMHDASAVCPGATAILNGQAYYRGSCILTDKDGDRAVLVFQCNAKVADRCVDQLQEWVGGTGKYTGIKGNITLNAGFIGAGPQGSSLWKGEWRLP